MKKFVLFVFAAIITVSSLIFLSNGKDHDVSGEDDTNIAINESNNQYDYIDKDSYNIPEKIIDVPALCQYPELPTGCEATAAAMILQFYGSDMTAEEFARNWLACDTSFYSMGGVQYGPDPNEVFAGDPFSEYSYGCYATPIVSAINKNSSKYEAQKITDKSLETLCNEYIDRGNPLLIWATMNMKPTKEGNSWYLQNGSKFTWIAGEHCLVLVGYNDDYYFLNDPQVGSTVAYKKEIAELRFEELGSQAVCISKIRR